VTALPKAPRISASPTGYILHGRIPLKSTAAIKSKVFKSANCILSADNYGHEVKYDRGPMKRLVAEEAANASFPSAAIMLCYALVDLPAPEYTHRFC